MTTTLTVASPIRCAESRRPTCRRACRLRAAARCSEPSGVGLRRPKLRELWAVSACVRSIKALLITATVTAVVCGSPALSATTHRPAAVAVGRASASRISYYVALGDSVAVWNGSSSYPYLILAHYQRKLPGLRLDDMAVSGATTGTMRHGGQYLAARSFLRAHRGHIALITIDIGGNDIVGCVGLGGIDPACSAQARSTIKRNLTAMLAGLHASARGVRVIGMTYYNPFLGDSSSTAAISPAAAPPTS